MSLVKNSAFDPRKGYVRGRGVFTLFCWQIVKWIFFRTVFPWPSVVKVYILRIFGSKIGRGVVLKPQINIHLPWKLEVGDDSWIGEEVMILNFEMVKIGSNACVSQRSFLCCGNHNFRDPAMSYRNGSIIIGDGVWVGAEVFVSPNVRIGEDSVVTVGSVVKTNLPAGMICEGNPCVPIKIRWCK